MKKSMGSLWVLILLLLTCGCNTYISMSYNNEEYHTLESGERFFDVNELSITWLSGTVRIESSLTHDAITLIEIIKGDYSEPYLAQVAQFEEKLDIMYCDSAIEMVGDYQKELLVYIPEHIVLDQLTLLNVDGDSIIKNVNVTNRLQVSSTTGSINIENVPVENMYISSTSSPLYIKLMIDNKVVNLSKISGQIILDIDKQIRGFIINFKEFTGLITSEFTLVKSEYNSQFVDPFFNINDLTIDLDKISSGVTINKY